MGFNFRMTDLQAAVGLVQLGRLDDVVARRRDIVARYQEELQDLPGVRCVQDPSWGICNFQSFWLELGPKARLSRDGLLAHLAAADISARRGIMAAHRQPAYAGADFGTASLEATEHLTDNTLILPVFHTMTEDEQERVVGAVRTGVLRPFARAGV